MSDKTTFELGDKDAALIMRGTEMELVLPKGGNDNDVVPPFHVLLAAVGFAACNDGSRGADLLRKLVQNFHKYGAESKDGEEESCTG